MKTNVTLSLDVEVVTKFKEANINLSKVVNNFLWDFTKNKNSENNLNKTIVEKESELLTLKEQENLVREEKEKQESEQNQLKKQQEEKSKSEKLIKLKTKYELIKNETIFDNLKIDYASGIVITSEAWYKIAQDLQKLGKNVGVKDLKDILENLGDLE